MTRRRIPLGDFGAIRCYKTADGRYKARGRFRELSGEYSSPSAIADTPEEAEELLRARKAVRPYGMVGLDPKSSVLHTSIWWLEGVRTSGRVSVGTLANYRGDVQHVNRAMGDARLSELTIATVDGVIRAPAANQPQTAIRVRKTLKMILDEAARVGAMRSNPVNSVRPPRVPPKQPYTLEPAQAHLLRGAYQDWLAQRKKPGPAPDPRVAAMRRHAGPGPAHRRAARTATPRHRSDVEPANARRSGHARRWREGRADLAGTPQSEASASSARASRTGG